MSALVVDFDAPLPGRLYWDASFLVHATYPAGRYHRECYELLDRLSDADDTASYISTLALDEVVFALIQLKVVEEYSERGFWDIYRPRSEDRGLDGVLLKSAPFDKLRGPWLANGGCGAKPVFRTFSGRMDAETRFGGLGIRCRLCL
jgi:hypothetical protein